jgi:hypothetical protein
VICPHGLSLFICRDTCPADLRDQRQIKNTLSLRSLRLVYLCQELFLMLFHETGKNIFKIALVIENVTLSNPGL